MGYLRHRIKEVPNQFTQDGNILGGAQTFHGVNLSAGNYEGEIQDIYNLPRRAKQKDEPLTEEEKSRYGPN